MQFNFSSSHLDICAHVRENVLRMASLRVVCNAVTDYKSRMKELR